MNSTFNEAWDITVEVFNLCAGSCAGCMLSQGERRDTALALSPNQFEQAVSALADYGNEIDAIFRPVLSFGDVPLISIQHLQRMFDVCHAFGLPFGLTITLASDTDTEQYGAALALASSYRDTVFDLTLDPIRYLNNAGYAKRVKWGLAMNKHNHVQVLLSEAALKKITPAELSRIVLEASPDGRATIAFTPTQANLLRAQYKYRTEAAAEFAKAFYSADPRHTTHFQQENSRFEATGSFSDFIRHSFHIGKGLNVFPVAYTPFGDIILDERNGGQALGSLSSMPLASLVESPLAGSLGVRNGIRMDEGDYGCEDCEWLDACSYHGVGIARHLYLDHEAKTGLCYGPRAFFGKKA